MSTKNKVSILEEFNLSIKKFCKCSDLFLEARTYSDSCPTDILAINDNSIIANIDENNAQIDISFELEKFSAQQINKIKEIIDLNPVMASELASKHLSEALLDKLEKESINLFGIEIVNISTSCDCPEGACCKHVITSCLKLAAEIENNPFLIFNLKGLSQTTFSGLLNQHASNKESLNKNLINKFQNCDDTNNLYESKIQHNELPDINLPEFDYESFINLLPANPLFYENKEFKSTLSNIYSIVTPEIDTIFNKNLSYKVRNTHFYLYFDETNTLKVFVTPSNYFILYLKNKGSRVNYSEDKLLVPVHKDSKIEFEAKYGVIIDIDLFIDYFIDFYTIEDKSNISDSTYFFDYTVHLVKEIVRSAHFLPDTISDNDASFYIRYVPLIDNSEITNLIQDYKSLMPLNIAFKHNQQTILKRSAYFDVLSIFLTGIIKKILFLKGAKLKKNEASTIFAKNLSFKSVTNDGKNIQKSVSNWLNRLHIKNKNVSPAIRIESASDDKFEIYIDILDKTSLKSDSVPLSVLFTEEKELFNYDIESLRPDVLRQIDSAADYLPILKEISNSKGLKKVVIDSKEIEEFILKTSSLLNDLGIYTFIPKEIKNFVSPKISVKANLKQNVQNVNYLSLSDILDFSYEIALGDKTITKDEFLQLVESNEGIIKFQDKYLLINQEEVNNIIKILQRPKPKLSSMEVLHSYLTNDFDDYYFNYDEALEKVINNITKVEEIDLPDNLNGTLRAYQERGYKWLYSNSVKGFGCCLADDMGLGKTIQVIALILKMKEEKQLTAPALVICPTTLVANWYKELEKFAPSLNAYIYHGIDRVMPEDKPDIIITTYSTLRMDIEKFKETEWKFVVIDEAHNIKNASTAQTQAVKSLKCDNKIALTGTPVENKLSELWSIFDFANKGYLKDLSFFQKYYGVPIEKFRDEEKIEKLKLAISPFLIRRVKTDKTIISDLPDKMLFDEYCYLTENQAALYEKVIQSIMDQIAKSSGIERRGLIFKLITALKQICNHPMQYTKDKAAELLKEHSGKAEKAMSIMENILEQNEKALIFTQYKEMGFLLEKMIQKELGHTADFFHGGLTRKQRDGIIDTFQNENKSNILIISLKAGGTGLNLTAATNVLHYDLWWNPAIENQATDRTYRIGQTKNVIVHRMITLGTFEEKIDEIIKSKRELVDLTISSGEKWITELTDGELKQIFSLS